MEMDVSLPSRPQPPLASDCCGQGCSPCVLDLYEQEVTVWEEECQRILSGEKQIDASNRQHHHVQTQQLSLTEYRGFTIEAVSQETSDTYRYRLSLPAGATLGLKTGQHIVIREEVDEESITRQYTPVSDINATAYFELLIKVYESGRMSRGVRSWKVGSQIQARGPYGSLSYKPNMYRRLYLLAVGTGLAPMSQIVRAVLGDEEDETQLQLLYGCRTYTDLLMKAELQDWARYWNFTATYYLSQEPPDVPQARYKYGEKIERRKIDHDVVSSTITDPQGNFLVLICGTRSFEQDMITCLQELGIPQEKYHKF